MTTKITFLIVLFLAGNLQAQKDAATESPGVDRKISFGFQTGVVVSTFSDEQPHTGEKIGFMMGGIVTYSLSDRFSIQSEPSYLQQGGSLLRFVDNTRFGDTSPFSIYNTNSRVTVHSLDLPFFFRYQLPVLESFKSYVAIGPAIGFTLAVSDRYERTYQFGQTYSTVTGQQYVTSQYEPIQFGVTTGIGGEVSLGGNKRLLVGMRYRYGITPIKKGFSYIDLYQVQGDIRTHSFYLMFGIGI